MGNICIKTHPKIGLYVRTVCAGIFNIILAGVLAEYQKLNSSMGPLCIWEVLVEGTPCLHLVFLWVSAFCQTHKYVYMNPPDIYVLSLHF